MTQTSAEARLHPRARARIRVDYHYASTAARGWSNDISEGGIFLHGDEVAVVGTRIYLTLHLPESEASEPLKIIGMVKRETERGMGIHFEVAYSRTRAQLSNFMRKMLLHSEPPPGR